MFGPTVRNHHEGWQVQDASIPHGGSFDPFHEIPGYCGKCKNAPCNRTFHFSWGSSGLRNPHTPAHSPGTRTWPPPRCGAKWHQQVRIGEGFFNNTGGWVFDRCRMGGAKRTVEVPATESTGSSSITAGILKSNFFPIPRFLANGLLMCEDVTVKNALPLRGSRQNDALDLTPCSTHPDSSFTSCC